MTAIELDNRCCSWVRWISQTRISEGGLVRRFAKAAGESGDLFDGGGLRPRGEVTDVHVLDHALAKWRHD